MVWFVLLVVGFVLLMAFFAKEPEPPITFDVEAPGNQRYAATVNRLARHYQHAAASNDLEQEKETLRQTEGPRVRLAGAVIDGRLSLQVLHQIIVQDQHSSGEQAKAIRLMLRFYPPRVVGYTLTQALFRRNKEFLQMARNQFERSPYEWELGQALDQMTGHHPGDEAWILGYLPFVSPAMQKRLCESLGKVGGTDAADALRDLHTYFQDHPKKESWIDLQLLEKTIQKMQMKASRQAGGALSIAEDQSLEGGLSAPKDQQGGLSIKRRP